MLVTLGNAIMATAEENNRLFADRPVNESKLSASTGLLNLFGASVGGIPMGHGAGGMAGHVAFDPRPGAPRSSSGSFLLVLALFLSGSVQTLSASCRRRSMGSSSFSPAHSSPSARATSASTRREVQSTTALYPAFFHLKTPNSIRITPIRYRMILVGERI